MRAFSIARLRYILVQKVSLGTDWREREHVTSCLGDFGGADMAPYCYPETVGTGWGEEFVKIHLGVSVHFKERLSAPPFG